MWSIEVVEDRLLAELNLEVDVVPLKILLVGRLASWKLPIHNIGHIVLH